MDKALQVEPLSWKGYSHSEHVSLVRFAKSLSLPVAALDKIAYCAESLNIVKNLSEEERISMQTMLLEYVDQSAVLCPFVGIMPAKQFDWIRTELEKYMQGVFFIVEALATEGADGPRLAKIKADMPTEIAAGFTRALATSRHNYSHFKRPNAYKDILDLPLYIELGVDILANNDIFALSEFQVRFTTPYPHLLGSLSRAYSKVFPELFAQYNLQIDAFPQRRNQLLQKAYELYATATNSKPSKLLVDAWAYLNNSGANWKTLAAEMDMDYILFDDLQVSDNHYERKYRRDNSLFMFNQPALHLIDPSEQFFKSINDEKLEEYEELGWLGMLERYLNRTLFLAHPPTTDILNDKGLYEFLPYVCKTLCGSAIELNPVESWQLWSADNAAQINTNVLALALSDKDSYVIAHRYLEGGMGIRVGASTSSEEWKSFLETFVCDHPSLYVLRKYFPMDPDLSLRGLAAGLARDYQSTPEEITCADSLFARFSLKSPLTSENSSCFVILPGS
jgi:hypothetical protein